MVTKSNFYLIIKIFHWIRQRNEIESGEWKGYKDNQSVDKDNESFEEIMMEDVIDDVESEAPTEVEKITEIETHEKEESDVKQNGDAVDSAAVVDDVGGDAAESIKDDESNKDADETNDSNFVKANSTDNGEESKEEILINTTNSIPPASEYASEKEAESNEKLEVNGSTSPENSCVDEKEQNNCDDLNKNNSEPCEDKEDVGSLNTDVEDKNNDEDSKTGVDEADQSNVDVNQKTSEECKDVDDVGSAATCEETKKEDDQKLTEVVANEHLINSENDLDGDDSRKEDKDTNGRADISEDEKQMITNLFQHFDSDKTGAMSISELGNFMRAIGKLNFDKTM